MPVSSGLGIVATWKKLLSVIIEPKFRTLIPTIKLLGDFVQNGIIPSDGLRKVFISKMKLTGAILFRYFVHRHTQGHTHRHAHHNKPSSTKLSRVWQTIWKVPLRITRSILFLQNIWYTWDPRIDESEPTLQLYVWNNDRVWGKSSLKMFLNTPLPII